MFLINPVLACDDQNIPFTVERLDKKFSSVPDDLTEFLISVPNTYDGWKLSSIFYRHENAHIPMRISEQNKENYVTTFLEISLVTLKSATIEAKYSSIPDKDGSVSLCGLTQVIDFGI